MARAARGISLPRPHPAGRLLGHAPLWEELSERSTELAAQDVDLREREQSLAALADELERKERLVRDADQEPINLVTQRFEATLDGRTAAAELGLNLKELESYLTTQSEDAIRAVRDAFVDSREPIKRLALKRVKDAYKREGIEAC